MNKRMALLSKKTIPDHLHHLLLWFFHPCCSWEGIACWHCSYHRPHDRKPDSDAFVWYLKTLVEGRHCPGSKDEWMDVKNPQKNQQTAPRQRHRTTYNGFQKSWWNQVSSSPRCIPFTQSVGTLVQQEMMKMTRHFWVHNGHSLTSSSGIHGAGCAIPDLRRLRSTRNLLANRATEYKGDCQDMGIQGVWHPASWIHHLDISIENMDGSGVPSREQQSTCR